MKYKLKDHVTDEMLIEVGFKIHGKYYKFASRNYGEGHENALYICLSKNYKGEAYRSVEWDLSYKCDDLTPYIQDLIDLNYVEVVE